MNLFRRPHHLTVKLLLAAFSFGLLGTARGLDEGLISTTVTQPSFKNAFNLNTSTFSSSENANRVSNVTSMVHIGSIPGALIAFLLKPTGTLWSMRQACVIWIVGVVIVISSVASMGQVLAGRFIMGLAIGELGVVAPMYLAEISPPAVRGGLVCTFAASEYLGIMIGYFAGWGASMHLPDTSSRQWVIPQSIQIMVAGILLLSSFLCEESPRFLCRRGHNERATQALSRLWGEPRDSPKIVSEIQCIQEQNELESREGRSKYSLGGLKNLFSEASNRSRLVFLVSAQVLSQWSGTNAITTYAPELFSILGVNGGSESLLKTAIFGAVKLVAALVCTLILIDNAGRKRTLISGIVIQLLAMTYIALYLTIISASSDNTHSGPTHRAGIAAIAALYFTGIGWALGWNSIQYLINAETFPLHVRAVGSSLMMCFHYANRYGLSKAVPSMLLENALQPKGTFWFFAALTALGLIWTWVFLPETARRNLEETNALVS